MRLSIILLTTLVSLNVSAKELAEIVSVAQQTASASAQQCKKVPVQVQVKKNKDGTTGGVIGGVGGAVAGGVIGNQISHSGGSLIGAAIGATGGAIAGNKIQKSQQSDYETQTVYKQVCTKNKSNNPNYKISYIYKNVPGSIISTKEYKLGTKVSLQELQNSAITK